MVAIKIISQKQEMNFSPDRQTCLEIKVVVAKSIHFVSLHSAAAMENKHSVPCGGFFFFPTAVA